MTFTFAFPNKIRLQHVLWGTFLLALFQCVTGTSPLYVLLISLFILFATLTVNMLGGVSSVNGFCIAIMALKLVVISQIAKTLLWQAGDSFLEIPVTTAMVLLVGIVSVYGAALFTRLFPVRNKLLRPVLDARVLFATTIITYTLGTLSCLYATGFGYDETTQTVNAGQAFGVARMLIKLIPFSIVTGTAYTLITSGNRRAFGPLSLIPMLTYFVLGALITSKQVLYDPVLYFVLTCVAFRYPFRVRQFVIVGAFAIIAVFVLYPFADYGRGVTRSMNFRENVSRTVDFVKDFFSSSQVTESGDEIVSRNFSRYLYYGRPMKLLDRLSQIQWADELVFATVERGISGWVTISHGFKMLLPRFVYPEKPAFGAGNFLGHKVGILWFGDDSTQISFGFLAESFSAFSWLGVATIPFFWASCFFLVNKKLTGSIHYNIWAVFLFGQLQHDFVEQPIAGLMAQMVYGTALVLGLQFLLSKIVPLIIARKSSVRGGQGERLSRVPSPYVLQRDLRSVPRT